MKKIICLFLIICMVLTAFTACDTTEHPHDHTTSDIEGELSGDESTSGGSQTTGNDDFIFTPPEIKPIVDTEITFKISETDSIVLRPDNTATYTRTEDNGVSKIFELKNGCFFIDEEKTKLVLTAESTMYDFLVFNVNLTDKTAVYDDNASYEFYMEFRNKIGNGNFSGLDDLREFSVKVSENGKASYEMSLAASGNTLTFTIKQGDQGLVISGKLLGVEDGMFRIDGEMKIDFSEAKTVLTGIASLAMIFPENWVELGGFECEGDHADFPELFISSSNRFNVECVCGCSLCGYRLPDPEKNADNNCHTCKRCSLPVHNYDETGKCKDCGYEHIHDWSDSVCIYCEKDCEHKVKNNCICTACGAELHTFNDKCVCTACGYTDHTLPTNSYGDPTDCVCTKCGERDHYYEWNDPYCTFCNAVCAHTDRDGCRCKTCGCYNVHTLGSNCDCTVCGATVHDIYDNGGKRNTCVCRKCNMQLEHDFFSSDQTCKYCNIPCPHKNKWDCFCSNCGRYLHILDDKCICTVCGEADHTIDEDQWGNRSSCICTVCGLPDHYYYYGICQYCGDKCSHPSADGCSCAVCETRVFHKLDESCKCSVCGMVEHEFERDERGDRIGCVCKRCNATEHDRTWGEPGCYYCDWVCPHNENVAVAGCYCTDCGSTVHTFNEHCVCTVCGYEDHDLYTYDDFEKDPTHYPCQCKNCEYARHSYFNDTCFYCSYKCTHSSVENCRCTECGTEAHKWDENGVCTECQTKRY